MTEPTRCSALLANGSEAVADAVDDGVDELVMDMSKPSTGACALKSTLSPTRFRSNVPERRN